MTHLEYGVRSSRAALVFTALVAMAACGTSADAPAGDSASAAATSASASGGTAQTADEQLADLGAYRLSMDKYDKYLAAQRNIMKKAQALSPSERQAMEARGDSRSKADGSLDDMVRNVESEPMMVAAVREAGLSPREFTMITMSMMQSAMAAGVVKMRPKDNRDSLIRAMKASPENVSFMSENEAEITRKQNELAAEMKSMEKAGAAP